MQRASESLPFMIRLTSSGSSGVLIYSIKKRLPGWQMVGPTVLEIHTAILVYTNAILMGFLGPGGKMKLREGIRFVSSTMRAYSRGE